MLACSAFIFCYLQLLKIPSNFSCAFVSLCWYIKKTVIASRDFSEQTEWYFKKSDGVTYLQLWCSSTLIWAGIHCQNRIQQLMPLKLWEYSFKICQALYKSIVTFIALKFLLWEETEVKQPFNLSVKHFTRILIRIGSS